MISKNILKFNRESIVFPTNSTKTTENYNLNLNLTLVLKLNQDVLKLKTQYIKEKLIYFLKN